MILLNSQPFHNLVYVYHNDLSIFLPNRHNKMMLARRHVLDERTLLIQVRVDDQVERKTRNLVQDIVLVAVLYLQEALVALE
jgi:hypothetical protein